MFEEIKDADLEKRSMRNVATTPTRPTPFGESGFSSDDLKGRFDLLPKYLATKINEILSALPNGNLANATKTLGGESVGWFIDGLVGGSSASKVKIVTPTEELTLQEAVTRLVKLLDEIDNGEFFNGFMKSLTSLDEEEGNLALEDYKDGLTFPNTYNRVYVEMTNGRGLYGRYCLTAVDAPKDPDPEDYAAGEKLDSIPMRMSNGYIMAPIIKADDVAALAKLAELGYNTDYYLMPKSYIDSYVDRLFTLGEKNGLMHGGSGVTNTGKCGMALGVNARVTADQASALGDDVESSAWGAFSINRGNKAKHAHSFVGGIGNFSTREGQTTLGRYAAGDGNYNFLVGVGDNDSNRKNGFGVMYDGRVLIGKDPTAPMHAVPLHLLDERLAAIVGSAPETLNALNELAAALGNDPNFATTVASQIGAKANKTELQETESAILDGLGAILAAQEEILGGA